MSSGTAVTTEVVQRLVDLACLAPSVHNTQPWAWRLTDGRIELRADRSRALPTEDAAGRNLLISCGAALHHFRVAARALSLEAQVDLLPEPSEPDLVASIVLVPGSPPLSPNDDLEVLRARCTDRRRFTRWPIPVAQLDSLCEEARAWDCQALPVSDLRSRFRIELLVNRAHQLHAGDLAAAVEQQSWVGRGIDDGIPAGVLPDRTTADWLPTRFAPSASLEQDATLESNDGVIILGGQSDGPEGWLRTGEGLSALWLLATRTGLSVVPLSLPIEVDGVRPEIESVIDNQFAAHLLVRIGWQAIGRSELPRTPRRPLPDVFSS